MSKENDKDDMGFLSSDFINAMKDADEKTEHPKTCTIDDGEECLSCGS